MTTTELVGFLAALFSMMNPIGGVGIFAGMTAEKFSKRSVLRLMKSALLEGLLFY